MNKGLKICPFCGAEIPDIAIKCRNCKEDLDITPNRQNQNIIKGKSKGGCIWSIFFIILIFVLIPINTKASESVNKSIEQAITYILAAKSEMKNKDFEKARDYYLKTNNIILSLLPYAITHFNKNNDNNETVNNIQKLYSESFGGVVVTHIFLNEDNKILPFLISTSQRIREQIKNPNNQLNNDQTKTYWFYELFPPLLLPETAKHINKLNHSTEGDRLNIYLKEYLTQLESHYNKNKEWVSLKNQLFQSGNKIIAQNAIPNEYRSHLGNGYKKIIQLDYEGAINDFNTAILSNNNISYGYVFRGITKIFLNRKESARQDFAKAIQIDQPNSFAYTNIYNTALSDRESFKQLIMFSSMNNNTDYNERPISFIDNLIKGGNSAKKTLRDIGNIYNAK